MADIVKITKGQPFVVYVPLVILNADGSKETVDASSINDVIVTISCGCEKMEMPYSPYLHYMVLSFEDGIQIGEYSIVISATLDTGRQFSLRINRAFGIVAWWQKGNRVYMGERVFFASKESLGWDCKRDDLNFSDWMVEIDSKTLNDSVNYGWDVFINDEEEYYVESQKELEALPAGKKFVSLAQLFAFIDEETGTIKNWDEGVAIKPFVIHYKHNRWHKTTITGEKIRIKYHFLEVDVRKNNIYRGSWRTFPAPPKIEGFYTFDDLEELDNSICYAYFAKRSNVEQRMRGEKIHTNRFRKIITYRDKISWIIEQNNIKRVIGGINGDLTRELNEYYIRVVIGKFHKRTGVTKKLYPISQCYIANIYVNRRERSLYIKRISGNMLMKQLF